MHSCHFVLLLLCCLLAGCSKEDPGWSDDLLIKAGFQCGWGAGTDSIVISRTSIKYTYYIPRESPLPKISKTRAVSASEWIEIQGCVNWLEFSKLDYNTCNICVDGCDEWISLEEGNTSRKITFGKELAIESISKLQTKLTGLRKEFSGK
jgi:hypothetical protein